MDITLFTHIMITISLHVSSVLITTHLYRI